MLFFGNIIHSQAAAPVKKPSCVVHPENAPRTIPNGGYPQDFHHYEYSGATIEMVARKGADDEIIRRPALVARMVKKYRTEEGGYVVEEMTASAKDLASGRHPDAPSITAALDVFYDTKIPEDQREAKRSPVAVQAHSAQVLTLPIAENEPQEKLNVAS
jgi:hypothetical protein